MAKNKNKRVATKHIRDGIKANYKKDCSCAVCGTGVDLELHHYTTVSLLLQKYSQENSIPIDTDEQVLEMRDAFYEAHWYELVDYAVTLCNKHHVELHKVYGQQPPLNTAKKQETWVAHKRDKHFGLVDSDEKSSTGRFQRFLEFITPSENRFSRHL